MEISKLLKKFDIKVIGKVTKEQQIRVSDNVATKITNEFNYIDYSYIYNKLMKLKMYIAILPEGIEKSIYSYEEDTLFISDEEDLNFISRELLYECIHAIQDIRNSKGKIKQLGQCLFSNFKLYAIALNESSIEYIVSKIFGEEEKYIEEYGIKVKTYSPNNYPLICNILSQLLFFSKEETLVKSTIYSTDDFASDGIEKIGQTSYINIQKKLDGMLYGSEEIKGIKRRIKEEIKDGYIEEIDKELNKICEKEVTIRKLYMDCQMTILTMYFDKLFTIIENLQEIKCYKNKLEDFKELIGFYTNKEQEYFLEYYKGYYKKKEEELLKKESNIKMKNNMALTIVSENPILQIFRKIKKVIIKHIKCDED